MTADQNPAPARAVEAFRRRIDAFFATAQAADLNAALGPAALPSRDTKRALTSRLDATLARLGADPAGSAFTLRKSLRLHDGRVVSVSGDAAPLGPDDDVRIVTTTTTVLEAERFRVETNVLVFERDRP